MSYKITDTIIVDNNKNIASIGTALFAGPVIIGGGTSTGTVSQPLQVTGINGAYIGGNLGIGSINPTSKLWVNGDIYGAGIVTAYTLNASKDPGTGIATDFTNSLFGNGWRVSSPGSTTYYKLATLPPGGGGNTFDHLIITGVLGAWTNGNQTPFEITFSNRGSFNYKYVSYGSVRSDVRIIGISTNSSVEIWAQHQASQFTKLVYNIPNSIESIVVSNPTSTTTAPTGTTVFDSSTATPRFIINESDYVGIGTTNPLQKLHVLGNLLVAAGSSTEQHITQKAYELNSGTLSWEGSAGQLFSITNNLTSGSIFSVNDVSGIPSIDVNADGTVTIATYGGNIGIGTTNPTSKLQVSGNVSVSGVVTATTFVGALTGTATSTTNIPNLTGAITSNNTTTSLGSFSSAQLATALTDETGSGANVFATSPTLVTPVLGDATATSIVVSSGSTFSNGPVLIGALTETGTASQRLQVTGGAYVSGNLGIGTTNPTSKLQVVGDTRVSGVVTAFDFYNDAEYPSVRPTLDLAFAQTKILDSRITFTRASTATYVNASGLIASAAVNEARFDHNPTTGESLGLLVEEARTNLVTWSQDFSQTDWSKAASTIVATAVASPIQGVNYQKIEATSANTTVGATSIAVTAATQQRAVSFFAQPLGNISRVLVVVQGADARINVNLADGTFTTNAAATGSTVAVSGQRFSVSTPTLTNATGVRFFLKQTGDTNTDTPTTIAIGEGLYLIGAQMEAGAFPTSYIPTTSATVTRAADVASITGSNFSSWYNQTEGTVFVDTASYGSRSGANNVGIVVASDGSSSNFVGILANAAASPNPIVQPQIYSGGVPQVVMSLADDAINTKSAMCYATNNVFAVLNNGNNSTDLSATMPSALDRLQIGDFPGTRLLNGTIKRLTYWPVRLPNAQLQTITL